MSSSKQLHLRKSIPLRVLHQMDPEYLKSEIERLAREYGYAAALADYDVIGAPMVVLNLDVFGVALKEGSDDVG